jgi:hypothetical protein
MRQLKLWTKPERQGQINARILNANCIVNSLSYLVNVAIFK